MQGQLAWRNEIQRIWPLKQAGKSPFIEDGGFCLLHCFYNGTDDLCWIIHAVLPTSLGSTGISEGQLAKVMVQAVATYLLVAKWPFWVVLGGRGVQHLKELAVKLSKRGFKFQLYSLTWASNSTSLHIFICKLGKNSPSLCFCCRQKLHWVNGSSFLRGVKLVERGSPLPG